MDEALELLRQKALDRRNVAIQAAKREYFLALRDIRNLARKLSLEKRGRPRKVQYDTPIRNGNGSCEDWSVVHTIELILGEGRPLTLVELTIEVQRRGCRAKDDPRVVAKAVRNCLGNYPDRFKRDEAGRWKVV